MRARTGRFGVDHSEILNYELEMANKPRDEHMNTLVYKVKDPNAIETDIQAQMEFEDRKFPGDMTTS